MSIIIVFLSAAIFWICVTAVVTRLERIADELKRFNDREDEKQ